MIVANTIAYVVSRSLQNVPIFDLLTRHDELVLPSLEEEREETILRIGDAMLPVPSVILNAEDHVADAARRVQDTPQAIFLIRMHPTGWNIIARDTLRLLSSEGKGEFTLASVISRANAAVSFSRSST